MDKIKGNLNLVIIIMTLLLVGFIIYNSFIKEDEGSGVNEVVIGQADADTRRIIEVLDKIDKIKIDSTFFNEKPSRDGYVMAFNELKDFSQPIPNKKPGKVNPFIRGGAVEYISQEVDNETNNEEGETVSNDEEIEGEGGVIETEIPQ